MSTANKIKAIRAKNSEAKASDIAHTLGVSKQRVSQILQTVGLPTRIASKVSRPEYLCWWNMVDRCVNPENQVFEYYGGRGIAVCSRWRYSFYKFFTDMGERPSVKHSIDRINNNGNYEPENCRWATKSQQSSNQRPRRKRV